MRVLAASAKTDKNRKIFQSNGCIPTCLMKSEVKCQPHSVCGGSYRNG